jgi:ATP phosphoribosyltransferase regulatory subunit
MNMGFSEGVIFRLRSLYSSRGYTRYKMNKFEEYDLYARNKDFLLSETRKSLFRA